MPALNDFMHKLWLQFDALDWFDRPQNQNIRTINRAMCVASTKIEESLSFIELFQSFFAPYSSFDEVEFAK